MAGEDNHGKRLAEGVPAEDLPMRQRMRILG